MDREICTKPHCRAGILAVRVEYTHNEAGDLFSTQRPPHSAFAHKIAHQLQPGTGYHSES